MLLLLYTRYNTKESFSRKQKTGVTDLLTLIFLILLISVFGKLLWFAVKAAWSVTKILVTIVFLPLVLIGIAASGLLSIAYLGVLAVGAVSLFLPSR